MAPVNRSRFAVLGMLSMGPASGYEIRRRLEERVAPFWQESYGQIYPLLGRLVEEGKVEVRSENSRGRTFALTSVGHEELVGWLITPPVPERSRHELLFKAFLGTEFPPDVLAGHIREFRTQLREELESFHASLAAIRERDDERRTYSELTVGYGITQNEAMLSWCDASLEALTPAND